MTQHQSGGHPSLIIFLALTIVGAVSLLPLQQWSNSLLRDFNLVADILPTDTTAINRQTAMPDAQPIDPALAELQQNTVAQQNETTTDPIASTTTEVDSLQPYEPLQLTLPDEISPRQGEIVVMEDYTPGRQGLARLKSALSQRDNRNVRIAVVGDSYIEGDIFTQDVRQLLQDEFGGAGVGYVNMYSEFPGFRRTVRQSGSGWKVYNATSRGHKNQYLSITEQYSIPDSSGNATASYKGVTKLRNLKSWNMSRFMFVAPNGATIKVKTDNSEWATHTVNPSPEAQCIEVPGITESFSVKTSTPLLTGIGVWLDNSTGVSVDCMSSRGFSGITLQRVSSELSQSMRRYIDYDLIILEFGINAMGAGQTDFTIYKNQMVKVIDHLRQCYPSADFVLMGIGDRGQKQGSEFVSMMSAPYMVAAQRKAAREAGCMFWDSREAMGGQDAIVAWVNHQPPHANKDYIHLNHAGGAVLANEFVKSFKHALNN